VKAATDYGFPTVINVMAYDHFRCEVVSNFLLNTCLPQQLKLDSVHGLYLSAGVAASHVSHDEEVANIPLITGSVAEFYVQPMCHVSAIWT